MTQKLLPLYGLKWNPFSPEIPAQGLTLTPELEHFLWRVENLARSGGFALVTGDPGCGKSVALRLLAERLAQERDLSVGVLTRPQSSVADFYRELGELFDVKLSPSNRWAGAKVLRQRWHAHIHSALLRPVLLIDEAQEMRSVVLGELRLLAAAELDSRSLLTVVLAGDERLVDKLKSPDLLPLGTRIRVRLPLEAAPPQQLADTLTHAITQAGNANLMTQELVATLSEHAAGNYRILMTLANELLDAALQRKLKQLDEKLYLDCFAVPSPPRRQRNRGAV
jgi:type II secretory pathway predicted ATPase ExeA